MFKLALVPIFMVGCMYASNDAVLPTATVQTMLYLPVIVLPAFEDQLLDLINAERGAHGLTALSILNQVAEAHSQDMVDRNFFSHINPDGLNAGARLANAGYKWQSWGELIGYGYVTPIAVFNGWMESPLHKAKILDTSYSEVGIGHVAGGTYTHYWTVVLTKPQ